jgi:hypothetical protein
MYDTNKYEDCSFDSALTHARNNGLTWLPWVGENYAKRKRRFLIVGESHYTNEKNESKRQIDIERISNYENFTRDVIFECQYNRDWNTPFFANLNRTLVTSDSINKENLWKEFAFYNFVQRLLTYNENLKERPSNEDFASGWRVFCDIIRVLKPTECLFIGVTAANYFNDAMATLGIEHTKVDYVGYFNRTRMKKASISINGLTTNILFIRHTSCYFSWPIWHDKVKSFFPDTISNLCQISEVKYIDQDNVESEPVQSLKFTERIPKHLAHKPIIACSMPEVAVPGSVDASSDAKFISVGRAQYNKDEASVKVFRHTGGRWSRQSEEVPIYRISYMMQVFLAAIIRIQAETPQLFQSDANEEIVAPYDIEFLRIQFNEHRKDIIKGLESVQDLLSQINLDKI